MRTYTYPAVFEPGDEAGIVITFPDVPEAISQGDDEADARFMGSEALGIALLAIIGMKRPLPAASKPEPGQVLLTVDADIAAKLAVLEAFRDAGITQAELAKRLGKDAREVRRILDPDHPTKIPALVAALAALGRRLVIGVEAA
ncbi:MAG: type II toxin-antitoxin system HicB family antitoxin [Beijerinckiaceae bacterium]|jgi:antitoxin HicB